METIALPWIVLISVILFDINDLIRGWWFYHNWIAVLVWNVYACTALYLIIKEIKKR